MTALWSDLRGRDATARAHLIGRLYEESLRFEVSRTSNAVEIRSAKSSRKATGSFFTPQSAVDFLVAEAFSRMKSRRPTVCDPACGAGAFLIDALVRMADTRTGRERVLETRIAGVDKDPLAVEVARFSLKWLAAGADGFVSAALPRVHVGDSLSRHVSDGRGVWRRRFGDVLERGGFDVIVGNPPYGARSAGNGIVAGRESAARFTTRAAELARDDGVLALVLPKSMTYVASWGPQRELLIDRHPPRVVVDLGLGFSGVLLEQVLLIAGGDGSSRVRSIRTGREVSVPCREPFVVRERFRLHVGGWRRGLVERLSRMGVLRDVCDVATGVGVVHQCSETAAGVQVIRGRDVRRYSAAPRMRLPRDFDLARWAHLLRPKVVVQDIVAHVKRPKPHLLVAAAVDEQGRLPVNTVSCLFPCDVSPHLLCAYLNSRLFAWWADFAVFNRAVRTIHLRGEALLSFPFIAHRASGRSGRQRVTPLVQAALRDPSCTPQMLRECDLDQRLRLGAAVIAALAELRSVGEVDGAAAIESAVDELWFSLFELSPADCDGVLEDVPPLLP